MTKFLSSLKNLDIHIVIKEKKAQILIAGAIFLVAMGICWSFVKGWSTITIKSTLKNMELSEQMYGDK